ncbi:MAG: hypothetical protein JO301_10710 [Chitinophagaceae bacterium]|nr:hypothetical protein [Chitinophagaceae bacterium]
MDLDELKHQLRNKLATDHAGMSDADIAALLTKKTDSVIGRIKRNLRIEIICSIAVILGFGAVGIFSGYSSLRIYFSVFAVVCIFFLILLIYLLRRTTRLSSTALPVRGNLQTIVHIIEEFTKRYFQFTMALVPICFVFSLWLGLSEKQQDAGGNGFDFRHYIVRWQAVSLLVAYMAALGVGVYFFTKWYLKKQFGRYVGLLKECIKELGE